MVCCTDIIYFALRLGEMQGKFLRDKTTSERLNAVKKVTYEIATVFHHLYAELKSAVISFFFTELSCSNVFLAIKDK